MPVYRIERRDRTRTVADTIILFSDLSGFGRMMDAGPASATVERILDALYALTRGTAQELGGIVRFNLGDSYCVTFAEAVQAIGVGRAFDPELGSNSASGAIRLHDQHRAAPWNPLHVPFFSLRPGRLDRLPTAERIG